MKSTIFKAGGALNDDDKSIYIERQADIDALFHLRLMDYIMIIEPRQQGKSSLINHLMGNPSLSNYTFAYIDVTTPDRSSESRWYQTFCSRILRHLRSIIPYEKLPAIPQTSYEWRDFLSDIAHFTTLAKQHCVIALDEIGAVDFPEATGFFSVLRDIYNSRQSETEFKKITFLLSGAFHPRNLIRDDKISPFNIAQRIRINDFTLAQACELSSKGDWTEKQAEEIAKRVYHWTDGQPYLTQLLYSYQRPDSTLIDIDNNIERLRRDDENHFPPLLERIKTDEKLRLYLEQIMTDGHIKFYPRENRRQAQLELLGLIKANDHGECVIRNRIYKQILQSQNYLPLTKQANQEEADMVMKIPQDLIENFKRGNIVLFIGAGLSIGAGLPSWQDLIRPLAAEIGYSGEDLIKAAQYYENKMGRQALISRIRDQLDTTNVVATENHELFVQLPVNIIFTTNFDDLLERTYQRLGRPTNLVIGASELPYWDESKVNIVKLHGTNERPESLVVTERDFNKVYRSNSLIIQQLVAMFSTKTFLFIGYSINDPDVNLLFDQVIVDLKDHQRRPYLVTFTMDVFIADNLRQRGFNLIHLPDSGNRNNQLATWLKALIKEVSNLDMTKNIHYPTYEWLQPQPVAPKESDSSEFVNRGSNMDYEQGLIILKEYAESSEWYPDFDLYEQQLRENLQDERHYGPSEQTRRDRARIIDHLNFITRENLNISFNDLCHGNNPHVQRLDKVTDIEIVSLLKELKNIVTKANSTQLEASERLWSAVQQGLIEQGEIKNLVDALRRWARSVQKNGLPMDTELRIAILSLAQPSEGLEGMYNYLHFALPLIPGLLSIESEIDLKKLWAEIQQRWGEKSI